MFSVPTANLRSTANEGKILEFSSPRGSSRHAWSEVTSQAGGVEHLVDTQALIALLNEAVRFADTNSPAARQSIRRAILLLEADHYQRYGGAGATHTLARGGLAPGCERRVKEHIEDNLGGVIRIEDLAAIARLSARHLSFAFKQSFGQPPHSYIVQRRIARAQEMMLTTDEPLSQIALACGLADQAHLSRWFRRLLGVTPYMWRRERRA